MVPQLGKKSPVFYKHLRFVTVWKTARHLSLSRAMLVSSKAPIFFLNIYFNIAIPYTARGSKWSSSLRFTDKNPVPTSLLSIHASCPAHLLFDWIFWCLLRTAYHENHHCAISPGAITSSLCGRNIFVTNLSVFCSLKVWDQVSHRYKKKGQHYSSVPLIFRFLDSKLDDRWFWTER
jgi:hypothetical protein